MFRVDFTNVQTLNANPVPAGTYRISVVSCKPGISKAGNQMLSWSAQIEEGEYSGRRVFFHTVITPDSLWKLKQTLWALGYTDEELEGEFEFDPQDVIGLEAMAVVTQQTYEGAITNNVQRLMPPTNFSQVSMDDTEDIDFNTVAENDDDLPPMTPAARELANTYNLSLDDFEGRTGTGTNGLFTKQDILDMASANENA